MTNQMQTVPFHGDQLEAVKGEKGDVWVSLRRCCECLGVSMQVQLRKLNTKSWASITEMVMQVANDGQRRRYTMISLDSLPMWLATIDERKVKPDTRPKLVRYQKEVARVLTEHFFPSPRPAPEARKLGLLDRLDLSLVVRDLDEIITTGVLAVESLKADLARAEERLARAEEQLAAVRHEKATKERLLAESREEAAKKNAAATSKSYIVQALCRRTVPVPHAN